MKLKRISETIIFILALLLMTIGGEFSFAGKVDDAAPDRTEVRPPDPVDSKVDTPDYAIGEEDFQGGEPESTFTIPGDGLISVEIEDNAIIEDTAPIETRGSQGRESESALGISSDNLISIEIEDDAIASQLLDEQGDPTNIFEQGINLEGVVKATRVEIVEGIVRLIAEPELPEPEPGGSEFGGLGEPPESEPSGSEPQQEPPTGGGQELLTDEDLYIAIANRSINVRYEEERKKYKKNYAPGKYKTVVIVFKGKVIVAPYNEEGPKYKKGILLTKGQSTSVEGEVSKAVPEKDNYPRK